MQTHFFPVAIILACAIHGLIATIIYLVLPQIPQQTEKSIPVVLVSSQQQSAAQQSASSAMEPSNIKNKVTTRANSTFRETHQTNKKPSKSSPSNRPEIPSISQPNLTQSARTQKANKGLHDIFGQNKSSVSAVKQISSKDLPKLSNYELKLLQKLVAEDYDLYHQLLSKTGKSQIDFTIEIILFSHGAIKTAKIHQSNEIEEVNQLAIQTAYNASPYEAPPKEDIDKGFRYLIPISYRNQ